MKIKGIYFLYRVLQAFGLPVLLLYFLLRGLRDRSYWRSLPQRFGFLATETGSSFSQTGPGSIWLHAVSVGEVLSCVEFVRKLRAELPETPLFVSSTTIAGRAIAAEKLRGLADGVFYAPVDYVFAVRRVLRILQPSVVVIAETEIWPNWFREVKRTGAGLALVNGRISDKAYPRYLPFRWLFRAVVPAADAILAQTPEIRERFLAIGAPPERVRATGNFKYDFAARAAAPDSPVASFLERVRPGKVWVAASTMPPAEEGDIDEDDAVISAFRELSASRPDLALILAPRKPERFDVVARKLQQAAIPYVRRSALPADARARVLLLDTIGELSGVLAFADVVFMGGTLARRGGHNILEPAFFARPVIVGPHMENFRAIAEEFRAAGASLEIGGAAELAGAVERLLDDCSGALEMGRKALACAEARRGATARAVEEVRELHAGHIPRYRPALPWFALRWPLARVWEWGARRTRRRDRRRQRQLDVPVISIGNITMGGTGKTPCVLRLAQVLRARGRKPGILTRGYGRGSHEKHLALAPGAAVHAEHSGDEPQIFVRSALAPVGIGADRFETGRLLASQFDIDVMLLDDGFQHLRLARDVDILLIDALDPFGGGDVFPLGRLREPLKGLERADAILITRTDLAATAAAIERAVRRWNSHAPIFRARVQPESWVEHRSGRSYSLSERPFERPAAFCGLGNPQSFLRTLENLGVAPAYWVPFEDHHRYRPHELRHLSHHSRASNADALVTTEKDAVNLCESADDLLAPLPLYWLKVTMAIEQESEFVDEIERRSRGLLKSR